MTSQIRLFLGLVGLTLLGVASAFLLTGANDSDQTFSDLKIIDAHIHTRFTGKPSRASGIISTKENLLKEMKENNVVGAVSLMSDSESVGYGGADLAEHNIIHCAGITKKVDSHLLETGLKSKKFSCMKIYLGYIPQYANHPQYHLVYKLARKYKVPVVFHTGDTVTEDGILKYSDPLQIDELSIQYRDVNFVIAHLGNPWIQSAAEVIYKNPNVYGDISAFLIGDLSKAPQNKLDEYITAPIKWSFGYIEDPKKLMFGTDWPLTGMKNYIDAVKKAIPKEHWPDVFYNNAVNVFKIPQK